MSWSSHSNFDLNQAAQMKRQLQSSIPSSNLAFFQPNFVMAGAKCLQVPSFQETCQPMSFTTLLFVARQFGLGQLSPRLFFKDILKPREGISEAMEASRVFQLESDLSSLYLHEWTRASFTFHLYDLQWQEWHSHLFCGPVHPSCISLDEDFASESEVTS